MMTYTNQAGDTIVEALIAIAIVSLVLVGAYVSTSHNTRAMQDTQERSQALKLVESQVELMRAADPAALNAKPNGATFCVDRDATLTANTADPACTKQPNGPGTTPSYALSITKVVSIGVATYTLNANWASLISTTNDNLTIYYRPGQ